MKALLPDREKKEGLNLALIVESPEKREASPEAEAKALEEERSLKAFCEKINERTLLIQVEPDPSGKMAIIRFQEPNL